MRQLQLLVDGVGPVGVVDVLGDTPLTVGLLIPHFRISGSCVMGLPAILPPER